MSWKKLIEVHKQIVKRGEDDFFTLYESTSNSRSSSINSFLMSSFAGPWNTNIDSLNNERFSDALRSNQHDQFFIGGPVIFRNGTSKLNPLIYKEVAIKTTRDNQIIIDPVQSKWVISPPIVRAILSESYIDDFDEWLKEKIEILNKNKNFNTRGVINSFLDDFPSLNDKFSFNEGADNWFIFTPPSKISIFNAHLMRDFETLEKKVTTSSGGLKIFQEQQKTALYDSTLMPLVPLNTQQEKAVKSILSPNPLSVITGPPGTGKSQVVIAALLNAWSQGKTVLFASTNNAAVDVIKDRLDDFNAGFPLYVRGGAKARNNIDHVLEQVLMFGQNDENINFEDIAVKEDRLVKEAASIHDVIESKKPEQITELYLSAQKAYAECLKEKSKVLEKEEYFEKEMKLHFNSVLDVSELADRAKSLQIWTDHFTEAYKQFQVQNTGLQDIELKLTSEIDRSNTILDPWKLKINATKDLVWVLKSSPEIFKDLNDSIETYVNELLLEEDPGSAMRDIDSRWANINEVKDSLKRLKKISDSINNNITDYDNRHRKLSAAKAQSKEIKEKCSNAGLKKTINVESSYFSDWIKTWLDYQATPKNWFSKLPFGDAGILSKKLIALESSFNQEIPIKVWNKIGDLNDDTRSQFAEYIELLEDLGKKQKRYDKESENFNEIKSDFQEFKKAAISAKVLNTDLPKDINWDDFLSIIDENINKANLTLNAFKKVSSVLAISKKIKECTSKVFDIRAEQTLIKEWFKSLLGSEYEEIINRLNKDSDHAAAKKFKYFYDQKSLSSIIDIWDELINIYNNSLPLEGQKRAILNSPEFRLIMDKFPLEKFNKPPINSFDDFNLVIDINKKIKSLHDDYLEFLDIGRSDLLTSSQDELLRALKQLRTASEILDYDDSKKMNLLIDKINGAELDKWPQAELEDGFSGFNEASLKAKLEMKNSEIAALSFEKVKAKWFEKISSNDSLQNAISNLKRQLGQNRNIIPENAYDDFKNVLQAIPIWISTAQATQSIPMLPELFDVVIMDEASQCTMTHAIPLIYRGKSFAAIGDPNQLQAIPSVKREEENAIASSIEYDDYPEHFRHFDNNVYQASFLNLYLGAKNQILLREHFRSHPLIIGFSNLNIYYEKYKQALIVKNHGKYSDIDDGLSHHQVSGKSERPSGGGSWINENEALSVCEVIKNIKDNPKYRSLDIGVVTPYKKHAELIVKFLTRANLIAGISVGTAHIYQGQEKDIMIFSTVVSNGMDSSSALWLSKPPNLLNVAITRARKKLIIVGDMDYCENNFSSDMLGKLAKYCKKIHLLSNISQEQKKLFELLILHGIEPEVEFPIADMHVDFCISAKGQNIVIEVDGDQHKEQQAHDRSRDATLRSLDFKVLRFSARDVRETPRKIVDQIISSLNLN